MNAILLFQASQLGDHIHPFVVSEVDAFCQQYEQVYLICFEYTCEAPELTRHNNLKVITVSPEKSQKNARAMFRLLTVHGLKDMAMAVRSGVFNKRYFSETAKVLMFGSALAKHALAIIGAKPEAEWVVEGYWLTGPAYAAAMAKRKYPKIVAVSRCHSAEADPVRNKYCVCQMKNFIYRYLDRIYFVSQWGKDNFEKNIMPRYGYKTCDKAQVSRLGTLRQSQSRNTGSADDVIRIVTCSRVVKLKRLELIAGALQRWESEQRIHWTHIGDGPDMEKLRGMAEHFPASVTYSMPGGMPNPEVHTYLATQPVDLFVNVSRFEGLPVSIMEAQSYGIPVLATDAGGTRELVDDSTGYLMPVDCDEDSVLAALRQLAEKLAVPEEKAKLQKAAFDRWSDLCDKEKNYCDFFADLDRVLQKIND